MITSAHDLLTRRYDTPDQAMMTKHLSQPVGSIIAMAAFSLRLSPNAVTVIGLLCMLAASLSFVMADTIEHVVLTALLWQVGFAFDCADGQLARATGKQSTFGAWLDVACDHIRQGSICLGIPAIYSEVMGYAAAMVLWAGLSVYLHTIVVIKKSNAPPLDAHGKAYVLRNILRELLDTPVFLLVLCVFRQWPALLIIVVSVYGLLNLVRALGLVHLRLQRAA